MARKKQLWPPLSRGLIIPLPPFTVAPLLALMQMQHVVYYGGFGRGFSLVFSASLQNNKDLASSFVHLAACVSSPYPPLPDTPVLFRIPSSVTRASPHFPPLAALSALSGSLWNVMSAVAAITTHWGRVEASPGCASAPIMMMCADQPVNINQIISLLRRARPG